jgi:glucuronoarabinoxylan endo-1,4-beta-xylanase
MRAALFAFCSVLFGCTVDVGDEPVAVELGAAANGASSVCWHDVRQTISGFGASSAWTLPDLSDELADELFSPERIGLSLLRLRISPNGTTSEARSALKAQERGARVWAAPWSPPGEWKTSGTDANGGSLFPESYGDWAARLAAFVRAREDEGLALYALSVQNEPDFVADWETCEWEPRELATFVGAHLVPALEQQRVSPRLLAPESANWGSIRRYGDALLADPEAGSAIDIVATHGYGNADPYAYRGPHDRGKELWMTEWSDPTGDGPDAGMDSGLVVARAIHENLTVAEVNAWHYWWITERGDTAPGRGGLMSQDAITRRGYVTGQFSRFVRPGSRRVRLSVESPRLGVLASAYLRETGSELVLVIVNENAEGVTQSFDFTGAEVGDLTPYVTNDDVALEAGPAVPGGTEVTLELAPRSVTTFTAPVVVDPAASVVEACSRVVPPEESDATGCACRLTGPGRAPPALYWVVPMVMIVSVLGRRASRSPSRRTLSVP